MSQHLEVRDGTKYVRFSIDVWYQEDDHSIHITAPGIPYFHTTVNNNPDSKRCHENLYGKLAKVLEENGRLSAK